MSGSTTTYADLFVGPDGVPKVGVKVPDSCIESAQHIIRCTVANKALAWPGLNIVAPSSYPVVVARFGGGQEVDLDAEDLEKWADCNTGVQDYPFSGLPGVGQGLLLLRRVWKKNPMNIHAVAVLAASVNGIGAITQIVVTAMSEDPGATIVGMAPLTTETITDIGNVKKAWRNTVAKDFALGLLEVKKPKVINQHSLGSIISATTN